MKLNRDFAVVADVGAAAFRRLCVETKKNQLSALRLISAAFRRLCVETQIVPVLHSEGYSAAFRRLCVETTEKKDGESLSPQPPSGGCVLKLMRDWVLHLTVFSRLQAAVC